MQHTVNTLLCMISGLSVDFLSLGDTYLKSPGHVVPCSSLRVDRGSIRPPSRITTVMKPSPDLWTLHPGDINRPPRFLGAASLQFSLRLYPAVPVYGHRNSATHTFLFTGSIFGRLHVSKYGPGCMREGWDMGIYFGRTRHTERVGAGCSQNFDKVGATHT